MIAVQSKSPPRSLAVTVPQPTLTRRNLPALLAAGPTQVAAAAQPIVLNDASRLSATPVVRHWLADTSDEAAFLDRLRAELRGAAEQRRPVAVSAARHSMGAQSLPRDGTAISMRGARLDIDRAARTCRVQAGTRWSSVIRRLDTEGLSPLVMQSNNDFGVGATLCVNAHGWPTPHGPFGSTVVAFRMMLADGSVVECSPTRNADMFRLAIGGYGLIGIVLDVEARLAANTLLQPRQEVMAADAFAPRFIAMANDPAVSMIYGRMNVSRADMFTEALLVSYRAAPVPRNGLPPVAQGGMMVHVARSIYRAQIGSEAAKRRRWLAEKRLVPALGAGMATRNRLMNEPVASLAGRDPRRTDILHEYFLPAARFGDFLAGCRAIIPPAKAEFLNVTLRHVLRDDLSLLAYARSDCIAAVLSFSQETTAEGEADMVRLTQALTDMVLGLGGSFYLPYRRHARPDQFARAYPGADEFRHAKRAHDPHLLFRNALWDTYLGT
jgi:FAD/FMN-containing dehydrogenase